MNTSTQLNARDPSFALRMILERADALISTRTLTVDRELLVGRDAAAGLCLEDDLVSRRHVMVRALADGLEVEDVSSNGTLVDGTPLRRARRTVGRECTLLLGASKLQLHRLDGADLGLTQEPAFVPLLAISPEAQANELRRSIHRSLLQQLDMSAFDPLRREDPTLRPRVLAALRRIVAQLGDSLPANVSADALVGEMADEALGLGPLEHLLADPQVTEIMVVDPTTIYVERGGKLTLSDKRFTDDERVRAVIERIVTPLGRRVDESSPLVDARLPDGSRVNIIIRPLALRGSCITIRKFARTPLTFAKLCELGSLNVPMARFLERSVRAKKNVVIAGGTGSGKTTLLNVLSGAIPSSERIVTIEDAAELQLPQPHVVSLESRPANMEGKGEVSIRELVKNALRMRPDRIVVGECRGGEALDMLQAMNTGHDGSLTTTHANSPEEAISRLETLCMMAGLGLPQEAIRRQIAKSVDLLVQQTRLSDGSRRVVSITELAGLGKDGSLRLRPIFEFARIGTGPEGQVEGAFRTTGYLPSYLHEMMVQGIIAPGEPSL
jgi:pilus assembly protein CpaF